MKYHEPLCISEILDSIKERQNLSRRLAECRALELWDEIAGSSIAAQTTFKEMKDGTLLLRISSAPLRHELSMRKSIIINEINRIMETQTVSDIRFI